MTSMSIDFTTTGRRAAKQEAALLVAAAGRGDVQVRRDSRWDVYLINGTERAEIRPAVVKLLQDGVLEVADPDADLSLIVPAGGVR